MSVTRHPEEVDGTPIPNEADSAPPIQTRVDAQRESFGLPPATPPELRASSLSRVDSDTDVVVTVGGAKVEVSLEGVEFRIIFRSKKA